MTYMVTEPNSRERALDLAVRAMNTLTGPERTHEALIATAEWVLCNEVAQSVPQIDLDAFRNYYEGDLSGQEDEGPAQSERERVFVLDDDTLHAGASLKDHFGFCLPSGAFAYGFHEIDIDPADFHPTQLDAELEYVAAPVLTVVRQPGAPVTWTKQPDGDWVDQDWLMRVSSEELADGSRKVLRWGFGTN